MALILMFTGGGAHDHKKVLDLNTSVWIYRVGSTGQFAVRYLKDFSLCKIAGLIDDHPALYHTNMYGYQVLSFEDAKKSLKADDVVIYCGDNDSYCLPYDVVSINMLGNGYNNLLHFWDLDISKILTSVTTNGYDNRYVSRLCAQEDFSDPEFLKVIQKILPNGVFFNRKVWEWAYIIRVLEYYGCLQPGKKGLGFAVGTESLPSYFASKGVTILASDLSAEDPSAADWISTQQNAGGNLEALYKEYLCTREEFAQNVSYRNINMNELPNDLGKYDFCWSSCAIEHVGSLSLSKDFLKNMIQYLKPGGVAVHTTEFNLSSNTDTLEEGGSVIFRKRDIEEMKAYFLAHGCSMETSYSRGTADGNMSIDIPPHFSKGAPMHINLILGGYASTSFAIVVQRSPNEK